MNWFFSVLISLFYFSIIYFPMTFMLIKGFSLKKTEPERAKKILKSAIIYFFIETGIILLIGLGICGSMIVNYFKTIK